MEVNGKAVVWEAERGVWVYESSGRKVADKLTAGLESAGVVAEPAPEVGPVDTVPEGVTVAVTEPEAAAPGADVPVSERRTGTVDYEWPASGRVLSALNAGERVFSLLARLGR